MPVPNVIFFIFLVNAAGSDRCGLLLPHVVKECFDKFIGVEYCQIGGGFS